MTRVNLDDRKIEMPKYIHQHDKIILDKGDVQNHHDD